MAKKHTEKQPPPSTSLKANQKQKKRPPPSSVAASFPTNSLANPEIIGKQKEKQVPPRRPPDSPSVSSSDGEEYPPSHLLENPAGASTAAVMPKHLESSSNSTDDVADEAESSESDYESKEEELQVEKKQPPLFPPSSNAKKKQVKQQPQSSIRSTVLDKSEKTGSNQKNKKQQQQPPLLDSPVASSSSGEESPPPPSYRLEKRASASTTAVLPKLNLDSLVEEEDESSETDHESNEEEPSNDFPVVDAKPNPQLLPQENKGKQTLSSTSRSGSGSEDEEGDEEEADSSSESDQPPPAPSSKQPKNMTMKNEVPVAEKVSDSSSESDEENSPPRISSKSTAAPPRSNPVDCPAKLVNKDNIIVTALSSSCSNSKRKRASEIREEAGQEKKFPFKRIWSTEDELSLLRGVLDYKKRYNIVPSNLGQLESLYNSLKGSISIPATLSQMIEKLRRIRLNYIKRDKKLKESMPIRSLNDHSAAIFNISTSIWGEEKRTLKNVNGKEKLAGYPSLHRFIKYEHTNCPSVLRLSHISNAISNKLEEKCENLEITEVRLHVKKQELFSVALELIDGALTKCG